MYVSSYIFQSPYSQPVQVGRPDPTMVKEQAEEQKAQNNQQQSGSTSLADSQAKAGLSELAIKSVSMYQKEGTTSATQLSVEEFMSFSKEAKRIDNLKTYTNNSGSVSTNG